MPRRASPAKVQLWSERLEAFKASGLSVAEFCKSLPCSPNSFYQWKRRIESNQDDSMAGTSNKSSAFLPVIVRATTELSLSIQLPNGVAIQVPCQATDTIRLVIEQVA